MWVKIAVGGGDYSMAVALLVLVGFFLNRICLFFCIEFLLLSSDSPWIMVANHLRSITLEGWVILMQMMNSDCMALGEIGYGYD